MKFELSESEAVKFREWASKHEDVYTGAIGGRYTFKFTPTSIGILVSVEDCVTKEQLNLTDYSLL